MLKHITFGLLAGAAIVGAASAAEQDPQSYLDLSLSQLSDIEVTSVSKQAEKASEAAAAIFVITQEDIRRSGATSIPEALRISPGLSVSQAGSHQWAISSRGFNDLFANKLLVLLDGRTVYTPQFSGVYWDVQDVLLDDIDRIEIIRGPGATLWGANAFNGVINIITKNAKDTQQDIVSLTAGTHDKFLAGSRFSGKIDEDTYFRVYGKHDNRGELKRLDGTGANDSWRKAQVGFRADHEPDESRHITLQGDIYEGDEDFPAVLPSVTAPFVTSIQDEMQVAGANILGRWTEQIAEDSEVSLQVYWDYVLRNNIVLDSKINTFDIDAQHAFSWGDRHEIVWGAGYRLISYDTDGTAYLNYTPSSRYDNLYSLFAQDKIALIEDTLYLTLGSKFEYNNYTGFEHQPNARASWLIDDSQTLWASVSRAVRTPNYTADNVSFAVGTTTVPGFGTAFTSLTGDETSDSEKLIAYELGYRVEPTEKLSFDIALFYNDYDSLINNRVATPFVQTGFGLPPRLVVPLFPSNTGKGQSRGLEFAANWDVNDWWQLAGSYSLLKLDLSGSSLVTAVGKSPEQQANLRSHMLLSDTVELDNALYYVDELQPTATTNIDDYIRFDTRIGWKPYESFEVSFVGQNLLDDSHQEFSPFTYQSSAEVGRRFYANLKWTF